MKLLALVALLAQIAVPAAKDPGAPFLVEIKIRTGLRNSPAATRGTFIVKVLPKWAPLGAARFRELVKAKFYDEAPFFRVIPGFMAQFGIAANLERGRMWQNRKISDEEHPSGANTRGTISFAHGGKNTRTTQCFINFGDNRRLDPEGFAPFGRVVRGMDVVDNIYAVGESPPGGKGVEQGRLWLEGGRQYLENSFPALSYIETARLLPVGAATKAGHLRKHRVAAAPRRPRRVAASAPAAPPASNSGQGNVANLAAHHDKEDGFVPHLCGEFHHHCYGLMGWSLMLTGTLGIFYVRPTRCRACTATLFAAAATVGSLATLVALGVPLRTAEEVIGVSVVVLLGLLCAVYSLHNSGSGSGGNSHNSGNSYSYSGAADWS